MIHLNKKILLRFFAEYPMHEYKEKKLIKILVKKLKRHIDEPFKLRNIDCWKKLSYYCNTKDKMPKYLKSQIKYEFSCPACNKKYIGKTDRNFGTHVQKHSCSDKKVTSLQSFVGM